MVDLSAEYDNRADVPEADEIIAGWSISAEAYRASASSSHTARFDLSYGDKERNRFDLFTPKKNPKGTVIFIHGGYWRMLDKTYWSHLAAGPLAHGWAVAIPSYSLAPKAKISEISREISMAIETVAGHQQGPLRLIGHSAGGHLVSRMNCADELLSQVTFDRVENTIAVSGLFDLEDLMHTAMNSDLKLDSDEVAVESPARIGPRQGAKITCFVGASEKPSFLRQNELLAVWRDQGAEVSTMSDPGKNHFTVISPLEDPDSILCGALFS